MFRVKICGITRNDDAIAAAEAGADAVGFNFYPQSPRCISFARAVEIAVHLPARVQRVGVFVNAPVDEIAPLVAGVPLDAVQLHGDETPEFLAELVSSLVNPVPILRAIRCKEADGLAGVLDHLGRIAAVGVELGGVLLDAHVPGTYGGTGKCVDWHEVAAQRRHIQPPLILAGGLHAGNVAEAIAATGADSVDTASGVETAPGRKCHEQVRQFVAHAIHAFRTCTGDH